MVRGPLRAGVPRRRDDARRTRQVDVPYTYNAEKKKYSFDGIDSFGADISATSTIISNVWHWTSFPMSMPDGTYIIRYNVTPVSDKEYTYVWQWSKNKGAWHPGGTGSGKKK